MALKKTTHILLWTIQGLLAALFLFAGGMKLAMPIDMLKGPVALPGDFLRFIGMCEVLGAAGLILPGLLRIRVSLTPLAAAGLGVIMVGATVVTILGGSAGQAVVPFVVGILAASVAVGRWGQLGRLVIGRSKLSSYPAPIANHQSPITQ